ncbi:MAG: hypothetical protein E4G90_00295 [Gemmatimonadales bacterium]|nr:MAG: hypothetical protein E4G90_00295 [Gemmatimonadales bacterium]
MLIDARYIGNLKLYWESFMDQLVSVNRNNNELKELSSRLARAAADLAAEVAKLPPQGRVIGLKMNAKVESSMLLGKINSLQRIEKLSRMMKDKLD